MDIKQNDMNWTNEKPTFTQDCILLTATWDEIRGDYEYGAFEITWGDGYWMWCLLDGEEIGDINDLRSDLYLIIPMLNV